VALGGLGKFNIGESGLLAEHLQHIHAAAHGHVAAVRLLVYSSARFLAGRNGVFAQGFGQFGLKNRVDGTIAFRAALVLVSAFGGLPFEGVVATIALAGHQFLEECHDLNTP